MKKKIVQVIAVLGGILVIAGLYFTMVKAGLPYQDPTPEMVAKYERDMGIGMVLLLAGLGTGIFCFVYTVICFLRKKTKGGAINFFKKC